MYLVCGARGNVGGELVRALAEAGDQVRALTRSGAADGLPAGVEAVAGDLDAPESLAEPLAGVRGVFLLPGYQDMAGVLREVARAGVEHVVLLSGSSAGDGDEGNAISDYMRRSEQAVHESGVAWTVLRPYGFMSNALRWVPELQAGDVVREPFADVAVAVVDPLDIASVAAAALRTPGRDGSTYVLSGPEALLPADRLRVVGEALGRDLRLDALSRDDARAALGEAMPAPYVDAMFRFYVDGTLDESAVQPTVEQVLGRPPRTFREWTAAHVAQLA